MSKKNTRKRLLAGALATVMMLTMCPSWALADDYDDIVTTLPAPEDSMPVVDVDDAADTIHTPDAGTEGQPENQDSEQAGQLENQDSEQAPSDSTGIEGSGNSTNPTVPEGSEKISQKDNAGSNAPKNETPSQDAPEDKIASLDAPSDGAEAVSVSSLNDVTIKAESWVTNCHVEDSDGNWKTPITKSTVGTDDNGKAVTDLANLQIESNDGKTYVFWQARVLPPGHQQTKGFNGDRTKEGFEIDRIRYVEKKLGIDYFAYHDKNNGTWNKFRKGIDQLVFYYLVRTDYSEKVQIDVSDWTVDKEPTDHKDRRSVTYQVITQGDDGKDKVLDTRTFWYKKALTVSSVRVRQTESANYTINDVKLVPDDLGTVNPVNGEYQFSLDLNTICDATVKIFVTPKPDPNPPTEPETKTPAMYFVLLPNLGVPKSGASQGTASYLPNDTSDGGVKGATRQTGYAGYLTKEGKAVADNGGTFSANGVDSNYLGLPENLGFFDKTNWSEDGKTYNKDTDTVEANITALLGTNYNPQIAEVVWYTVKYDSTDGYHVDGYVKNVDVNVTYHSNFVAEGAEEETTYPHTATTGTVYQELTYGATELPERQGCTFGGWYTDKACTTAYVPTTLMTNLHLYAKWNCHVTYLVDGEKYGETDTYKVGADVEIRAIPTTQEGYHFVGWTSNDPEFNVNGFKMPARDVTIEGTFVANPYNVIYKVDGKYYGETETYHVSDDVKIRKAPTKEGHTFVGWTPAKDVANIIKVDDNGKFKMPAHDVLFNGTFVANEYKVTYKVDGKDYATDTYKFSDDVAIRTIPTKEGYTFSGWKIGDKDAANFTMPAHDVTIEGTFVKNSSGGHHHRKPTVTIPDDVPTGLNGDDHYAYIVGYPDGTVRPQDGITRAEVATIFFRLLTDETRNANSTKSNSYSDVDSNAWYNHAVSTLSAMGIIKGSNGKFNPNAPITRAEFAAIAARFDDKANTTTADFSDIASHWAKNEISAASNNGWINGYTDGTFRPDNHITRAEAMTLVNRVLKRLPETAEDLHDDMIKWSDNSDTSAWYYLAVQEATNSHYYETKKNEHEKWSKLRETRDWTELEK